MSDLNPYEESLAIDLAKANNRIEELIAERDEAWKRAGHAEKMWGELEVKLSESEALLAKAVEALSSWKHYDESGEVDHVSLMLNYADAIEKTRTTLAELTGGKDG